MAKPQVDRTDVHIVEQLLARHEKLTHVRVRRHADLLILESGPSDNPLRHARLRRETIQYWRLEMPSHGRWERTPIRGTEEQVLEILIDDFGWMLAPILDYPARFSDRRY